MTYRLNIVAVLSAIGGSLVLFVLSGCVTRSAKNYIGPLGVRFHGNQVQDKIMSSVVVYQKYSSLKWENDGRYSTEGRETWWREVAENERISLRNSRRLQDLGVVFYPMIGTNGWLGIDFGTTGTLIPILNDVVGKGVHATIHPREYEDEVRVAKRFSSKPNLPMPEEDEEQAYDPFLFDGNRRLMYRTFNPDEQYYEYDALRETLQPVTTNRVAEVKRTYKDLYRIPVGGQFRYWKEDANGQLRPDFKYYHPLDPVRDAVPKW